MRKRWQLSHDGTIWNDCFPINGDAHRITQERDLDIGLIAFRKKLTSPLVFCNRNGVADYDWIRAFADDPDTRCQTLYVRLQYLCDGTWSEFYRGKFSAGSCRWDLRGCIVEVKPDTVDRYTCLMDKLEDKLNLIDVSATGCEAFFNTNIPFVRPYDEARLLKDVFEFAIGEAGCGDATSVASDFFEWNAIGDAPGYSSGVNYVYGGTNRYNLLYIDAKSNTFGTTPPSNPATKAEFTLKDLFLWMKGIFNVYWTIDESGIIRLEHWKYWVYPLGIDIPLLDQKRVVEPLAYEHLSNRIPSVERFLWHDKGTAPASVDFDGKDITYSGACVLTDGRDPVEESAFPITTDLLLLVSAGTNPSPSGFVIIATAPNSPSPDLAINANGAISGTSRTNGPMAWANLHRDLFTWNRYLPSGNLNGVDVDFDDYRPNIEQDRVSIDLCCELVDFDASERVNTNLSERLGTGYAFVESCEHDIAHNRTRFTLRYQF